MADMTDDDAVTGPTASRGAVSVMLLGASDLTGELASAFRHLGADVATVPGYSDTAELTALIDESPWSNGSSRSPLFSRMPS